MRMSDRFPARAGNTGGHRAQRARPQRCEPPGPAARSLMIRSRAGAVDPVLITEIVLVLLLFGLGVALFIIPTARADVSPAWWVGVLLAALFFAVIFLETLRRRRGSSAASFDPDAFADDPEPRPRDPGG